MLAMTDTIFSASSGAAPHHTRATPVPVPSFTLSSAVLEEVGRLRGERFCAAINTLRSLPNMPAHRDAAAALATVQGVLDYLTIKSTTTSEGTRTEIAKGVMAALLDDAVPAYFLSVCGAEAAVIEGAASPPPSLIERMARMLDVLLWVVDAACTPLIEAVRVFGLGAVQRNAASAVELWCTLVTYDAALLQLTRVGLASTSGEDGRWGAPVQAGVVRLLDALLQTCAALRTAAMKAEVDEEACAQIVVCMAVRLGCTLVSETVLRRVAAQLAMPVFVLDEVDGFTSQLHTLAYDPLRHGPLSLKVGKAQSTASLIPWTLADDTRCPQSPLELYSCAVAFLAHAAAYYSAFPTHCDEESSVTTSVWAVYVRVLERALQEGETALTFPAAGLNVDAGEATPQDELAHDFVSPLKMRVRLFAATRSAITAVPPQEGHLPDSEPASLCKSPVANPRTTSPGKEANCTTQQQQQLHTARTVFRGRRSFDFPACPPCSRAYPSTSPAAPPVTVESEACVHHACMQEPNTREAENSVRSNDVTFAGMTDSEANSVCGESAVLSSVARSRPIAIFSAKTIATNVAASQGGGARGERRSLTLSGTAKTAGTSSPPSTCCSPSHRSVPLRRDTSNGDATRPGPSTSSPHQYLLRKSTLSPATAAAPRPSPRMDPLFRNAHGEGRAYHIGSSKSSCLQRHVQPMAAAQVRHPPMLRRVFPSNVQLTLAVLTSLAHISSPLTSSVGGMTALIDARVLTVMSELLEYPGNTLQEVVMATVENCFTFWEAVVAQRPHLLLLLPRPPAADTATVGDGAFKSPLPTPLRACLSAFTDFIGWDGEGWVALHTQYLHRALRLVMDVVNFIQRATSLTGRTALHQLTSPSTTAPTPYSALLVHVVHHLLSHGVVAHIWRCLSMDATQVPGAMVRSASKSTDAATAATAAPPRAGHSPPRTSMMALDPFSISSYGCFLYGAPSPISRALLSEAQCTAMQLLHTIAKAFSWSAVPSSALAMAVTSVPGAEGAGPVPDAATYCSFMEESFKHLPACANCLRRCTYTRSQSLPIVPDDHEALRRLLQILRVVFAAMGAGAKQGDADVTNWVARRRTWLHQIADSQLLDVLAHIGTAAELVSFALPRLCLFTLRSFLENVHVLAGGPLVGGNDTAWSVEGAAKTAGVARARVGMAALQALVVDPPTPPPTAATPSWRRRAVRESLLVILLARLQRRCAGQSANASVPQRLEVFALLIDVLAPLVDGLPTSLSAASTNACRASYDLDTATELVRITQRVVAASMACRVWSGTAQELRYLEPNSTTPVKETLRFSCRVAQLVNGSLRALLCVSPQSTPPPPPQQPTSRGSESDALGRRMATVLLAETNSVTFAFHVMTMDLPLALAGLINGVRWQTTNKTATPSTNATTTSSSGSSSNSSRRNAAEATPQTRAGVTMVALPPSSLLPRCVEQPSDFANEDRRETCEAAASTLVELLCALRRVEALLLSPAPVPADVLAALPCRSGSQVLPPALASSVRAIAALTATDPTTETPDGSTTSPLADQAAHYDVVVVQRQGADFAGVVTTMHFPRAAAALSGPAAALLDASPNPINNSDAPTGGAASTPAPTAADATAEDPHNWRQTEAQWRRRLPLLRTSLKDALRALDLEVLDRYLAIRQRQVRRAGGAAKEASGNVDVEADLAEGAVTFLTAEKKRCLKSL